MLDPAEVTKIIRDAGPQAMRMFRALSDSEQYLVMAALNDPATYSTLVDIDFKQDPIPPEKFFADPYYIGRESVWNDDEKTGIYPGWYDELCYVLDPDNQIVEWILSGCLGAGKTQSALWACVYKLYWLTCLREPTKYIGIGANSVAEFFFLTVNLATASDILLERFENMIRRSPYFRENFPPNRRRRVSRSTGRNNGVGDFKLEFPPFFSVIEGSGDMHFISRDVLVALMDEANFLEKSKVSLTKTNYGAESTGYSLYIKLRNRITSRFLKQGKMLGFMCLISSAASDNMFLEQHKKWARMDPKAHISEFALYDIQPWKFDFSKQFKVFVGGKGASSRILKPGEVESTEFGHIIEVPINLKDTYEKDLPQALREFSGITTDVAHPLITVKEQIYQCIENSIPYPFLEERDEDGQPTGITAGHLSESNEIIDAFNPSRIVRWDGAHRVPQIHRGATRFIHVDLAISGCAVGMAMGHVSGVRVVRSQDHDGGMVAVRVPVIQMDFVLRLLPPPPPEHHGYMKIRGFIVYLRDVLNFPIGIVSLDGYQSEDTLQLLERNGFNTKKLSVDSKSGPYEALSGAISESRISYYYYPPLLNELENLQKLSDGRKTIIDHVPGGSKDVSDSVAGVTWWCSEHVMSGDWDGSDYTSQQRVKELAPRENMIRVKTPRGMLDII